ncbi:hypothetical protein AMTR_s00035p00104570 [Amborella trichopoda]|uniref:Uncharacterized protein n=1 Tax=Amborella trichopoda TaxID=13333 RepID=W1PXA8_AMBTC|nr:hypothetical protein AMTR_s00035p00104570 [Amborella trichopoda]
MTVRRGDGAWLREAEVVEDEGGASRERRGDEVRAATGCSWLEVSCSRAEMKVYATEWRRGEEERGTSEGEVWLHRLRISEGGGGVVERESNRMDGSCRDEKMNSGWW